jgi:transposase InsO family protein
VSKAKLIITAVTVEGRSQAEAAAAYGVSKGWVSRLLARYRDEGEAAFEPRSRRPKNTPTATPAATVELIVRIRTELTGQGLDAGPDTIRWHLEHRHGIHLGRATVSRHLTAQGLVVPEPKKRPKSSYIRFEASLPNERWQADFTHYRLTQPDGTPGADVEILSWIDDCSRFALSVTAHAPVTGPVVSATFRDTVAEHGIPASTLTDNGMVFTTRLAGGKGGRNALERQLRDLGVRQINSTPGHPTTCGKVERFQQTLKKWLRAQPVQPATVEQLQARLDAFARTYNHRRPHRSLPHRATPATIYTTRPKAAPPQGSRATDTHDRVRRDRVDKAGKITLRHGGTLYSIGIGRTHARTRVIVLAQDLQIRIIDAATGELLRELTLDPSKRYQGTGRPPGPPPK